MGKIKRLAMYMVPFISLGGFLSIFWSISNTALMNQFGTSMLAGYSVFSSSINLIVPFLSPATIILVILCSIVSERGRLKAAYVIHLVALIYCAAVITFSAIISIFANGLIFDMFYSSFHRGSEFVAFSAMSRSFGITLILLSAISVGLGFVLPKNIKARFFVSIVICVAMTLTAFLLEFAGIRLFYTPSVFYGISAALRFVRGYVLPLALLPIRRFYKEFYDVPSEKTATESCFGPEPISNDNDFQ